MSDPPVGTVRNCKEPSGQLWTFGIEWERVRGRYEPVQIQVRSKPAPISASALRRLPLGEIIAKARRDLRLTGVQIERSATDELKRKRKEHVVEFGPHRGVPVSYDELVKAAKAYREAYPNGGVTAAVAKACRVSSSTAGKRIMAARKAGLLNGIGRQS